jgi:SAM-dependent methyltransferase
MGFDSTAIRFFLTSKSEVPENPKTLVLGRQSISPTVWLLFNLKVKKLVNDWKTLHYADDFFTCSGILNPDYLDFSPYEGANILHDLAKPLPQDHVNKYDLVIEAGTLEHVPDIQVAITNTKKALKLGGYLIAISPANNFLGHGCYQLSPEIFHRSFSPDQGFEVIYSVLHVEGPLGGRWYHVPNSSTINQRVEIHTKRATYFCILAKKVSLSNKETKNQSDYEAVWSTPPKVSRMGSVFLKSPYAVKRIISILFLKKKYKFQAKKRLVKIRKHGSLQLPDLKNFK